jgi:cell division septum initiation protein DivIVA
MDITNLSPQQLRQAADLKEKIDDLQTELNAILGGEGSTPIAAEPAAVPKKRKMTASWRKALSLAQKARWAAKRGEAPIKTAPATVSKVKAKRYISPALRKARSEAMKARWAKARRAGKSRP